MVKEWAPARGEVWMGRGAFCMGLRSWQLGCGRDGCFNSWDGWVGVVNGVFEMFSEGCLGTCIQIPPLHLTTRLRTGWLEAVCPHLFQYDAICGPGLFVHRSFPGRPSRHLRMSSWISNWSIFDPDECRLRTSDKLKLQGQ